LILDTHVHLLINKRCRPNWDEIEFTFEVAAADGLDVLCIAEHRDSEGYEELVEGLFLKCRFEGESLDDGVFRLASGLVISAAAEVALAGGGDIGVHARPALLLGIDKSKSVHTGESLLKHLGEHQGDHVTVAHHLFVNGKWPLDFERWALTVDAIELPGKQLNLEREYRDLSSRFEKPTVGGGDSHTWVQLGACRSNVELGEGAHFTVSNFKTALRNKNVQAIPTANASRFVGLSKLYRQRLERAESTTAT
jgi:hypothetical protein